MIVQSLSNMQSYAIPYLIRQALPKISTGRYQNHVFIQEQNILLQVKSTYA